MNRLLFCCAHPRAATAGTTMGADPYTTGPAYGATGYGATGNHHAGRHAAEAATVAAVAEHEHNKHQRQRAFGGGGLFGRRRPATAIGATPGVAPVRRRKFLGLL
eukprot:SM000446S16114  [mRNA]  locus=s446:7818:8456:+ [translate_table: standard]